LPWRYSHYNDSAHLPGWPIAKAPWQLRLFGEEGRNYLGVMKSQVPHALKLFPEAAIAAIEDDDDLELFVPPGVRIHDR